MSIISAIIGSAVNQTISVLPEPGGWTPSVNNAVTDSLRWKIYNNYHNESTDLSGMTLLQNDVYGFPNLAAGEDYRTYMFTGYMMLPSTGNYIFRSTSDDGSYVWIGPSAWEGNYNIGNALVNNGGLHPSVSVDSLTINMIGSVWYPIRILFGNATGGTVLTFQYSFNFGGFTTPSYANNSGTAEGFN